MAVSKTVASEISQSMKAVIQAATSDYLFLTWEDLMVAVWRGQTSIPAIHAGEKLLKAHAAKYPAGILLLTVIEENAPPPGLAERTALGKMLKNSEGRTRRSAVIFEGSGFRAATVRSVVTGVLLFSSPPFPHKVFATVPTAATFLAATEKIDPKRTAKRIVEVVAEARSGA